MARYDNQQLQLQNPTDFLFRALTLLGAIDTTNNRLTPDAFTYPDPLKRDQHPSEFSAFDCRTWPLKADSECVPPLLRRYTRGVGALKKLDLNDQNLKCTNTHDNHFSIQYPAPYSAATADEMRAYEDGLRTLAEMAELVWYKV